MYARSTTIHGNPQNLDEGIAFVRDTVMPAVQELDGCVGLSMLCDRDSGRCITTTAWADAEAMRRSADRVRDIRARAAEILGGVAEVDEWEIALLHRMDEAPEGACCRVVWGRGDPAQTDDRISTFRMAMLPRLDELAGFCSVSMLVDRQGGRGVTATVYESRDAMNRAADQAMSMREEFGRQMGVEITEVAEFELVLAHLRVPETV